MKYRLKFGTYPVTLPAGHWWDILQCLEANKKVCERNSLPLAAEQYGKIMKAILEQAEERA